MPLEVLCYAILLQETVKMMVKNVDFCHKTCMFQKKTVILRRKRKTNNEERRQVWQ